MEDLDVIKEFVIESTENLTRLDQEMVELEKQPDNSVLLASIFRTIHTIKGTCGFLGFSVLEAVTHQAENILSQLRNGERALTSELVSLILKSVDAIKVELTSIEASARESGATYSELVARLKETAAACPKAAKREKQADVKPSAEAAPVPSPTAAAGAEASPGGAPKVTSVADSTIRVDVGLLDKLMNLVGELVLARNQVLQFSASHEDLGLNATSQRLNLITTELQEGVMKTRMQPIGNIWSKLPRVVRDLAAACGKQIALELEGAETELDKTIIEAIKDPLTHIVRNSCDHGIEDPAARVEAGKAAQGRLSLRAFHEGGNVIIEVSDDGRGIDPQRVKRSAIEKGLLRPEQAERMRDTELVNLVFMPGFSTAAKISNISGRGVGMDVVKTNIEKIGGAVDLVSRPGKGTTVRVRIPLTLAIIPGLVVTSGGQRFVIPQASLIELVRFEGAEARKHIEWIQGAPVCRLRGHLLPLIALDETLKLTEAAVRRSFDLFNIVVLQADERQFGLIVDEINDTQEIVVKPLGKQMKSVPTYAGATIMGDGRIALILDVAGVAQCAAVFSDTRAQSASEAGNAKDDRSIERQALLLFRAGEFERIAVPLSVVARLEEFPRNNLERAAGRSVIQYRGQILPLIALAEYLGTFSSEQAASDPTVNVIVFSNGERRIGLVVDRVLDIVEDSVVTPKPSNRPGLLGSGVVGQKITDFLDLHGVIQQVDKGWLSERAERSEATVLLADASPFSRGVLRSTLELAGYRVLEANSASDALEKLRRHKVNVVASAMDLPGGLLQSIRRDPALAGMPVLAITAEEHDVRGASSRDPEFDDYAARFDREGMLRSISRLAEAVEHAEEALTTV